AITHRWWRLLIFNVRFPACQRVSVYMDGILFDRHLTTAEIEAGMPHVLSSPLNNGTLKMIVARPAVGKRKVLELGELSVTDGLIGDNWSTRGSRRTADGSAHPEMQINI